MTRQIEGTMPRAGGVEALKELVAAKIGTDSALRLFTNGFAPNEASTRADFEAAEATFNSYTPEPLTFGAVGIDQTGRPFVMSDNIEFQNVTGANPETIGGAWVDVDVVGPPAVEAPILFFLFDPPIEMTAALKTFGMKVVLTAPDLSSYAVVEG